jgi:Rrf2 family protein
VLSFSHTTGYAILALGCIGNWKGERVFSEQIHECTGVPTPYLRQILFDLGKFGLIEGKRGYQGGFVLTRPAEKITLLDVVRAVEPEHSASDCLLALAGCSDATPCPVRGFWQKERARIEAKLRRITIAQAAESIRAAKWAQLATCPPPDRVKKRRASCGKASNRKKTTRSRRTS